MDELIDLTPHRDEPILACRGTVYEVLRSRGESDFVADLYAFKGPASTRPGTPITSRDLHAFYDGGPDLMRLKQLNMAITCLENADRLGSQDYAQLDKWRAERREIMDREAAE